MNHQAKTKCPCGYELHIVFKKPSWFTPTIKKIQCPNCESRFFFTSEVDKEDRGHGRRFKSHFEVIELTDKVETVSLKARALARGAIRKLIGKEP